MANVKVFADKQTDKRTEGRTNRQTKGPKTICPDLYVFFLTLQGHK